MGKFNNKSVQSRKTQTYEGGVAYKKQLEDEWTNMLFSFMLQSGNHGFYRTVDEAQSRYIELTNQMIEKYGPAFVGKAAIFARNELGMRTISELTAAMLNGVQFEGKREFYSKYFHRPDGIGEVFGAIDSLGMKRSHALVRGVCDYLETLSAYQIGKYPMKNHTYNMHDIINICHPKSENIDKYQKGILEKPDTWEVSIHSKHGQEREQEWKRLVEEKKLGYLALIRNLRNILNCEFVKIPWIEEFLVPQIVNETAIKKSLVFPYQIYTAYKALDVVIPLEIEIALSEAFKLAIGNMPELPGKSCVVLDVSGSMESRMSKNNALTIKEVCAVYAAALYSSDKFDCDFIKFGTRAAYFSNTYKNISIFKLIKLMANNDSMGYGTEIKAVFNILNEHYDRIFLFSDMQVMDPNPWYGNAAYQMFDEYKKIYGDSKIYSFDLGNYATQIVSDRQDLVYITALNDVVFKIIEMLEDPKKSLIDIVKNYEV